MSHQNIKDLIHMALLNELDEEEMEQLHHHLIECGECQAEYEKLSRFYSKLDQINKKEEDDQLLHDARKELSRKLDDELSKRSFFQKAADSIISFITFNRAPVFAGAGSLAAGLLLGYMFFAQPAANPGDAAIDNLQLNQAKISNVRFIEPVTNEGNVEFVFDAVKQVHVKGNLKDLHVQNLLARAMVNEKNPGIRIQTASAIASQALSENQTDPKIKQALITTLEKDNNPAVRREALKAILNYPFDEEIQKSLLYVLINDDNSGLRIAAINGLASAKLNGNSIDSNTIKILNDQVAKDENDYVRMRAAALVKDSKDVYGLN